MKTVKKPKRWDELLRRLDKTKTTKVAEVGVWHGKMSLQLLSRTTQMILYMIDRWEKPAVEDTYSNSGSEISVSNQAAFDSAFHSSVNIAARFRGRAHVIKDDSAKAANRFDDGSLDIVFIDGDHSYQGCSRDVKAWLPKVRKGGWLGGHDYAHPDQGNVKKAVDEMFSGRIILGANRTWWVKI